MRKELTSYLAGGDFQPELVRGGLARLVLAVERAGDQHQSSVG